MADVIFPEDTITGQVPGDEVVAGPDTVGFDYTSSELLILGGDTWPGQWEIDPSGCKRDIDKKKPRGSHGHTMRDNGLVGGMIKVVGTLTEEERSQCSERIRRTVPTEDSGIKVPQTIAHPDCNECGISFVYVERLKVKSPKTGKDFHIIEMDLGQWFPQPKEVKQPPPVGTPGQVDTSPMAIFRGLQQDPGPFGTEASDDEFSEEMGRFADGQDPIVVPDQDIPPVEEP